MNTPIKILDEMIDESKEIAPPWGECHKAILVKAKERIEKECTIVLSTNYNTYNIPYGLVKEFEKDNSEFEKYNKESDSWYELCDKFDSKYSQYQV